MLPVEFEDEVLVHPVGAEHAPRLAGGDDLAVADGEGVRGAVDVDPAGQVLAVEQVDRPIGGGARGRRENDGDSTNGAMNHDGLRLATLRRSGPERFSEASLNNIVQTTFVFPGTETVGVGSGPHS